MKVALLATVLLAMLGFALLAAQHVWRAAGIDIGWFGWTVLGVGAALTIALGVGLMWLSFHSARAGYDQNAQDAAAALDPTLDRSANRDD